MSPPSGIVTFLFTDIEGSTRRWEADADTMRAELAAHDEVLRAAIESRGGWLFKHTGDGVCAAFSSPRSAIDAAVDAQRALTLPVRMGIATGEAELRGDDYFGPALNRAARVMGAGHGGQILVVASTASLVTGVDLVDLGPRLLRDLSQPVQIFQVRADGLRTEFPALKTLDDVPGNLRPQGTSFLGRDAEVAELETAMRVHRVVTLTGVGGVGKTRLALQVAAQLVGDFPEGVWVIELAPVGDPTAVPDAVALVLGITQQAGMTVAQGIAAALDGRQRLLVFDNCEHVLDAAADLIDAILARSSTVKILATSREGLRVVDEHLWPVPSLSTHEGAESIGVALFIERAGAVVRGFMATRPDETAAIVEICQRLDGIPLAIELAAVRMVSMSPTEVRDRLGDRFRLLSGSRRGLERHQTLRHAVQWSYDLLDPDEQSLLNRCAVFAGCFDLAAAVAVAGVGQLDDYAVLDLLAALVRKSLINADRTDGRTRFAMLETIRQFAEDQLATTGTSDTARTAHARYYAGKESELLTLWNSPNQRHAYDWLNSDLDNLRVAFRWAAEREDIDTAAAIATYTGFIGWFAKVYEPIGWAEELLDTARAINHRRLAVLLALAASCFYAGRSLETAVSYSDAGVGLVDDPRYDPFPFGFPGCFLAVPHVYNARPEMFVELCQSDIDRTGDPLALARACVVSGLVYCGRVDEATAIAGQVVVAAEATGNPGSLAFALCGFGGASRGSDPQGAIRALRRGMAIGLDSGNTMYGVTCASTLANLEAEHGDPGVACDLFAQAISIYHDAGDAMGASIAMVGLATFLDRIGRLEPAAVLWGSATNPLTVITHPEWASTDASLRDALGAERYDALTRQGAAMKPADAVRYALAEIELAREQLGPATLD
jgi:predicted ATPase